MTDFLYLEFKFASNDCDSTFDVVVIVHTDDVGASIRKVVRFALMMHYEPRSVNVTCIMDASFISSCILYKPRFCFHDTPGAYVSATKPTLQWFMNNFKKSIKNETF